MKHSDYFCLIELSFYENYPVFSHARKLGVMLQAEILWEVKRWSMALRFRLCCLSVVVAVNEAHFVFLVFPSLAS